MNAGPILSKLVGDDIDEKIYLNQKQGIDIVKLREMIKEEMTDFIWTKIRCEVQIQFYVEQLEHMEKRIKQLKFLELENPYEKENYKEILAKIAI